MPRWPRSNGTLPATLVESASASPESLISQRQVTAPDGAVTSTADAAIMDRVILAILREIQQSTKEAPDIGKALQKAGANTEMYAQLVQQPDWGRRFEFWQWEYIVRPQAASLLKAQMEKAKQGDTRAFTAILEAKPIMDANSIEADFAAMLRNVGVEAAQKMLRDKADELIQIADSLGANNALTENLQLGAAKVIAEENDAPRRRRRGVKSA